MGKQFSTIASRTGAHDRQPQNTCLGIDGACPVLLRLSRWRVFLLMRRSPASCPRPMSFEPGMILGASGAAGLLLFRAFFPNAAKGAFGLLIASMVVDLAASLSYLPSLVCSMQVIGAGFASIAGSLGRSCPLGGVSQDCGVRSCRVAGWDCLRRGNRHAVRRQRGVLGSPCSIDRSRRRRSCAPCGLPSMLCGRTLRRCDPGLRWADAKRAGCA